MSLNPGETPSFACRQQIKDNAVLTFYVEPTFHAPENIMNCSVLQFQNVLAFASKLIGIEGVVQLDIYSSDGSLILSLRIEKVQNEQTILFNLKQLPSGTYLVQINHKNFQKALRFIKVN